MGGAKGTDANLSKPWGQVSPFSFDTASPSAARSPAATSRLTCDTDSRVSAANADIVK